MAFVQRALAKNDTNCQFVYLLHLQVMNELYSFRDCGREKLNSDNVGVYLKSLLFLWVECWELHV